MFKDLLEELDSKLILLCLLFRLINNLTADNSEIKNVRDTPPEWLAG